jgi:hypothetical protein
LVYFVDTYIIVFNATVDPDGLFEKGTPDKQVTLVADALYHSAKPTAYVTKMALVAFPFGTGGKVMEVLLGYK